MIKYKEMKAKVSNGGSVMITLVHRQISPKIYVLKMPFDFNTLNSHSNRKHKS